MYLLLRREINQISTVVPECVVGALYKMIHNEPVTTVGRRGKGVVADVVQADARILGDLDRTLDTDFTGKDIVDAERCGEVVLDIVRNFVGGISVLRSVLAHVCLLVW